MVWYHPKHYKELEKIRKELEAKLKRQAASNKQEGASNEEKEQAGQAEARDPKDPWRMGLCQWIPGTSAKAQAATKCRAV